MNSIFYSDKKGRCFICGKVGATEKHHIFGGGMRDLSEKYGLTMHLCHSCHNESPNGLHYNANFANATKEYAQYVAMRHYKWSVEDFRKLFRKNYLEDEEIEEIKRAIEFDKKIAEKIEKEKENVNKQSSFNGSFSV